MQEDLNIEKKKIHVKTVNIDTAGQLSILLSDWVKKDIKELKIIGQMNGSDFKIISDMATNNKLWFIDLSETNIVSGGDYYCISYSTKYFTKNDEFGSLLFKGCKK